MEIHQLRYAVAVARAGNFSRAAARCHVSQPSLSQQIKKLEEELGERLFERLKREVKLTPQGELLVRRAERILGEVEAARREASEARDLARGVVAVGVLPTIAPYFLPKILSGFHRAFPGVELVVHEDTTARLEALLAAREIDVAIASEPIKAERLERAVLFSEELLVAMEAGHRLSKKRAIRLTDLEAERFILMKEGHCLGDQVLNFCAGRGMDPRVVCRSAQVETIRALVRAGMGISLVPSMACEAGSSRAGLRYRRLAPPRPSRRIIALWLEGRPLGRAATALIDHLRTACQKPAAPRHSERPGAR
jgi:LysR family hydrogen peroxide-inducible transcriptional activator